MKTNIIAVVGISALALFAFAFVSIFEIRLVSAQVDASSSIPLTTDTTTVPQILETSTSTAPTGNDASSTAASTSASDTSSTTTVATSTPEPPAAAGQQPPQGLAEVHIVGTKYIDYFTDGTTVTSYPGDPTIDSHLAEPNAPIPTHGGLTWVHTTGGYLYDTPSGDLDVGDYALQPNGTFIQNAPPFVSSTSTPAVSSPTDGTPAAPAVLGASTSSVSATSNTSTLPETSAATDTVSAESPSPDAPGSSSAASTAPATTTGS